ncbi:hypothetical protein GGS24DRAFT_461739 [Hypoxylon argillaceum]|nr:hypothetical protein GGS24DRAFT_461739 [Hypoxylon argillaceum]
MPSCQLAQAGEEFRDERCSHRWCPCDGQPWACCQCRSLSRWAECGRCGHMRCAAGCEAGADPARWGTPRWEDPRYIQWRRSYLTQERNRAMGGRPRRQ